MLPKKDESGILILLPEMTSKKTDDDRVSHHGAIAISGRSPAAAVVSHFNTTSCMGFMPCGAL